MPASKTDAMLVFHRRSPCVPPFDPGAGSALVEAALIVPLVILIVIGIIKTGINLADKVEKASAEHKLQAERITAASGTRGEQILRGKWTLDIREE